MSNLKLQGVISQLSDLTPAELSEVKAAVDERLANHLRIISANDDLTAEEWALVDGNNLMGCVRLVRDRTGLGLRDARNYMDRARARR